MVNRLVTTRPAPWLHAAAIGAWTSLTIVMCHDHPHFAWIMAPLAFVWARFIGWVLLRFLFRKTRSHIVGRVELQQASETLHESIHNFVNGLSVLQGDVDLMIMRAGRLKGVFDKLADGGE